jgi:hypothetical protein
MLLRPFDVSKVRHPISENITSWTVDEYKSAVCERTAQPSRQKRSWLPFLGRIARTIFGVATEKDVTTLHCHINKFEHLKSEVLTDQMHILETVHSLYQTQDKGVNILNRMMQGFDYNMTLFQDEVYKTIFQLLGIGALQYETLLIWK